jgi:hypothetical protein
MAPVPSYSRDDNRARHHPLHLYPPGLEAGELRSLPTEDRASLWVSPPWTYAVAFPTAWPRSAGDGCTQAYHRRWRGFPPFRHLQHIIVRHTQKGCLEDPGPLCAPRKPRWVAAYSHNQGRRTSVEGALVPAVAVDNLHFVVRIEEGRTSLRERRNSCGLQRGLQQLEVGHSRPSKRVLLPLEETSSPAQECLPSTRHCPRQPYAAQPLCIWQSAHPTLDP